LQIADAVKIRFETSETNLDIVARLYERFNQRKINALIAALDPDVLFEPGPEAGPYRRTCSGRDEVRRLFKQLSKTVRKFQAQPLQVLERGDEIFVLVRMYGKFRVRIEAWLPVLHHWTLEDGRVVGWRSFPARGMSFEEAILNADRELARTGTTESIEAGAEAGSTAAIA
jgi:ketosteroid isomerase-like protein